MSETSGGSAIRSAGAFRIVLLVASERKAFTEPELATNHLSTKRSDLQHAEGFISTGVRLTGFISTGLHFISTGELLPE